MEERLYELPEGWVWTRLGDIADKINPGFPMDHYIPAIQKFLIKGERMKYEYALMLASAYCLSVNADTVYYYRNEDFKWK